MWIFHPVNILAVSRNVLLILLSKICLFFKFSQTCILKNVLKSKDSKSVLIFSLALLVVELLAELFLLNKSCKTYLGPKLPPGGRNWQLLCPNCILHFLLFNITKTTDIIQKIEY
jgi:hypothetical protein